MPVSTEVSLHGVIVGDIWMPNAECAKSISLWEDEFRFSDNTRPSVRDFAMRAVCDGDFQGCKLTSDSYFTFKRINATATGSVVKARHVPVTCFASIADCIDERDSCEVLPDFDEEN